MTDGVAYAGTASIGPGGDPTGWMKVLALVGALAAIITVHGVLTQDRADHAFGASLRDSTLSVVGGVSEIGDSLVVLPLWTLGADSGLVVHCTNCDGGSAELPELVVCMAETIYARFSGGSYEWRVRTGSPTGQRRGTTLGTVQVTTQWGQYTRGANDEYFQLATSGQRASPEISYAWEVLPAQECGSTPRPVPPA